MSKQKKLLITKCSDPLMWYADKIGQVVPYLGEKYGFYTSREDAGYTNVVNMDDAILIDDDYGGLRINKDTFDNPPLISLPKCTRVEVIDENGRSYVNWNEDNRVELSVQDDGKTLKVFITKRKLESMMEEERSEFFIDDKIEAFIDELLVQLKRLEEKEMYEACTKYEELIDSFKTKNVEKYIRLMFDIEGLTRDGFLDEGDTIEDIEQRIITFFSLESIFHYSLINKSVGFPQY